MFLDDIHIRNSFYFIFFILFEKQTDRWREIDVETETAHPVAHFPNAHSSKVGPGQSQHMKLTRSPMWMAGIHVVWPSPAVSLGARE